MLGEYEGDRKYYKDGKLPSNNDRMVHLPAGRAGKITVNAHLVARSRFLYLLGSKSCFTTYAQDGVHHSSISAGCCSMDGSSSVITGGVAAGGGESRVNAILERYVDEPSGETRIRLRTDKKIGPGEEILIDYGSSYWSLPPRIPGSRDIRCRPVWAMREHFFKAVEQVKTAWKEHKEKEAANALSNLNAADNSRTPSRGSSGSSSGGSSASGDSSSGDGSSSHSSSADDEDA